MTSPRITEAIRDLDYDFSNFTLRHFIEHVRSRRERPLVVRGFAFDGELPGGWVKMPDADFVFYDDTAHPVQQIHTLLHEIGHIVLNHKPYPLEEVLPSHIIGRLAPQVRSRLLGQFRQPTAKKTPQEREAELFVCELRSNIFAANRLEQLTGRSSSIDGVARYARNMGYHD